MCLIRLSGAHIRPSPCAVFFHFHTTNHEWRRNPEFYGSTLSSLLVSYCNLHLSTLCNADMFSALFCNTQNTHGLFGCA